MSRGNLLYMLPALPRPVCPRPTRPVLLPQAKAYPNSVRKSQQLASPTSLDVTILIVVKTSCQS